MQDAESGLLYRFGRFVARRHRAVIGVWLVALVGLGSLAPFLPGALDDGGFTNVRSESYAASQEFRTKLGGLGAAQVVVVFTPSAGSALTTADPAYARAVDAALAPVRAIGAVANITEPFPTPDGRPGDPAQIGTDGRTTYAIVDLDVDIDNAAAALDPVRAALAAPAGLDVRLTGGPALYEDIQRATADDLLTAETIGIPVALVVLFLAFGSAVAAALPLVAGAIAVGATLGLLFGVAHVYPLSIFVLNTATMLGLAVGIDYALLLVSRYREELRGGRDPEDALGVTVARAGRSVIFSSLAVFIGLSGMWFFGLPVLTSLALGGSIVVAMSALAAVTLLPALLAAFGRHLDRGRIPMLSRRSAVGGAPAAGWARLARVVMARPFAFIAVGIVLAGVLASPARHARFGVPESEVIPARYESRAAFLALSRATDPNRLRPIILVGEAPRGDADLPALLAVATRVAADPRVRDVRSVFTLTDQIAAAEAAAGQAPPGAESPDPVVRARAVLATPAGQVARRYVFADGTWAITAVPMGSANSGEANAVVDDLRAARATSPLPYRLTGSTAGSQDFLAALAARAPIAAAFVLSTMFVVLLFAFRSVVLPVKAIFMNLVSIGASFGVLVWIFQSGHLSGVLNFTPLGYLESTQPIVLFCVVFGLSMDYEVFMLSRVQEAWTRTGDNRAAVAEGLVRTGGIVTSAASIMVVIGLSFAFTGVIIVKQLGLGLALAVLLDATLVRCLLVPATMRVLGRANWWAPRFLRPSAPPAEPTPRPLVHR